MAERPDRVTVGERPADLRSLGVFAGRPIPCARVTEMTLGRLLVEVEELSTSAPLTRALGAVDVTLDGGPVVPTNTAHHHLNQAHSAMVVPLMSRHKPGNHHAEAAGARQQGPRLHIRDGRTCRDRACGVRRSAARRTALFCKRGSVRDCIPDRLGFFVFFDPEPRVVGGWSLGPNPPSARDDASHKHRAHRRPEGLPRL